VDIPFLKQAIKSSEVADERELWDRVKGTHNEPKRVTSAAAGMTDGSLIPAETFGSAKKKQNEKVMDERDHGGSKGAPGKKIRGGWARRRRGNFGGYIDAEGRFAALAGNAKGERLVIGP